MAKRTSRKTLARGYSTAGLSSEQKRARLVRAPTGELLTQRQYIRRTHTGHTPEQIREAKLLHTNAGRLDTFVAQAQQGAYRGKSRAQLLKDESYRRDVQLTIKGTSRSPKSERAQAMVRLGLRSSSDTRPIGDSPKRRRR